MSSKPQENKDKSKVTGPVIGIDLGTTYCCVGIYRHGTTEIINNSDGKRTTPSTIAFKKDGSVAVGQSAVTQQSRNYENTIYDCKRLIGHKYNDQTVKDDMKKWPFKVVSGKNGAPMISVNNGTQNLHAFEVSSKLLAYLKQTAEDFLGKPIGGAVITVPAYFSDAQRHETQDAAKVAGINVLRIINEPTAAAVAYGLDKNKSGQVSGERNVLIFDLGGGTFDVSILAIEDAIFEVKATGGDTHLGGKDFDNHIVEIVAEQIKQRFNIDILSPNLDKKSAAYKLKKKVQIKAEEVKKSLSTNLTADVELEINGEDEVIPITKAKFENKLHASTQKCLQTVEDVIKKSNLNKSQIHDVVLVGGSTRIPLIRKQLAKYLFGSEDAESKLCRSINPDEAVAVGAAIQASIISGQAEGDEATKDLLLIDVTPLNLGIETYGGRMAILIKANSPIPSKNSQIFTTKDDNQPGVGIKIYQGQSELTEYNKLLGEFTLSGIPPAPGGVPQIEVTCDIDQNGVFNISAKEKSSGKEEAIKIQNTSAAYSAEEVEELKRKAEENKEEASKEVARIEARNKAEGSLLRYKRTFDENKNNDKFSKEDKETIESTVKEFEPKINNHDLSAEEYEKFEKELNEKLMPIFAKLHAGAGGAQGGMPGGMGGMPGGMGGMGGMPGGMGGMGGMPGGMGGMGGQGGAGAGAGPGPSVEEVD